MALELHTDPVAVTVSIDDADVARFATTSDVSAVDLPKPHVHPIRTLAGVEITGFAPEDHPWHHGLQFAFPRVNDHNLWGGGTFHHLDRGYVVGTDHGTMRHDAWTTQTADDDHATVVESVLWRGNAGEALLDETRCWHLSRVDAGGAAGYALDLDTVLANRAGEPVTLATPGGRGRPDGGYGGLFLRLAEGFAAEALLGEAGELTVSGDASRTLVVHGRTAAGEAVTLGLAFSDDDAPGVQRWLYRFDPFSAIGWATAYDHDLNVAADDAITFRHRLVVLDGHIDAEAVRALL